MLAVDNFWGSFGHKHSNTKHTNRQCTNTLQNVSNARALIKENITSADTIILNLLQKEAKHGLDVLAYETGLSVASIQRRLKSLRSRKLILGDVAIKDPVKVGLPMTFIVLVEMERERIDRIDAFFCRAQDELLVQQCYYVTDEADFCLMCVTKSMFDFEDFTKHLFFKNSKVRRFRTSDAMGNKKVSLKITIQPNTT